MSARDSDDEPRTYVELERTGETYFVLFDRSFRSPSIQAMSTATGPQTFTIAQGDEEPPLEGVLLDENRTPIFESITSFRRLHFRVRSPTGDLVIDNRAEVADRETGLVRYRWQSGDTDITDGSYRAAFVLETRSGELTVPNAHQFTLQITR